MRHKWPCPAEGLLETMNFTGPSGQCSPRLPCPETVSPNPKAHGLDPGSPQHCASYAKLGYTVLKPFVGTWCQAYSRGFCRASCRRWAPRMLHAFHARASLAKAWRFLNLTGAAQSSKTGSAKTVTTPPKWRAKTTTSRRASKRRFVEDRRSFVDEPIESTS